MHDDGRVTHTLHSYSWHYNFKLMFSTDTFAGVLREQITARTERQQQRIRYVALDKLITKVQQQ